MARRLYSDAVWVKLAEQSLEDKKQLASRAAINSSESLQKTDSIQKLNLRKSSIVYKVNYLITWNFRDAFFREFRDFYLSDAKNKCREYNMTRKLSSKLVKNQERISLVYLKTVCNFKTEVNAEVNLEDVNVDLKLDHSFWDEFLQFGC